MCSCLDKTGMQIGVANSAINLENHKPGRPMREFQQDIRDRLKNTLKPMK